MKVKYIELIRDNYLGIPAGVELEVNVSSGSMPHNINYDITAQEVNAHSTGHKVPDDDFLYFIDGNHVEVV
jgi:hypothetical protein